MSDVKLHLGDCLEVMRGMPDKSVDTIITDPPYGLEFMGKDWDKGVPGVAFWQAAYRVAKPGAILLAFGGTRTYHRLACAIEDAGFEIRDTIAWVYGSGFPKSYNISKGIDKQAGAERKITGKRTDGRYAYHFQDGNNQFVNAESNTRKEVNSKTGLLTAPATPEAQLWDGWGTALKPAHEPIVVAMKPLDGTFVNNALKWGVAGLWIDGGRVEYAEQEPDNRIGTDFVSNGGDASANANDNQVPNKYYVQMYKSQGRFPANIIHDGSDEVTKGFPNDAQRFFYSAKASRSERNAGLDGSEIVMIQLTGNSKTISGGKEWESQARSQKHLVDTGRLVARAIGESTWMVDTKWSIESFGKNIMEASPTDITFTTKTGTNLTTTSPTLNYLMRLLISDSIQDVKLETGNGGNPARIAEGCSQSLSITIGRTASLPGVGDVASGTQLIISVNEGNATENKPGLLTNFHSTVKPLALMRYLARLTKTPTGGVVLDPFMGSGTTGVACVQTGRNFIGIEIDPTYFAIAERRIRDAQAHAPLPFGGTQ